MREHTCATPRPLLSKLLQDVARSQKSPLQTEYRASNCSIRIHHESAQMQSPSLSHESAAEEQPCYSGSGGAISIAQEGDQSGRNPTRACANYVAISHTKTTYRGCDNTEYNKSTGRRGAETLEIWDHLPWAVRRQQEATPVPWGPTQMRAPAIGQGPRRTAAEPPLQRRSLDQHLRAVFAEEAASRSLHLPPQGKPICFPHLFGRSSSYLITITITCNHWNPSRCIDDCTSSAYP